MFDNKGRYVIENYGKKSVFASFLPGISGKFGIPIWTFYVNRGQGITSFGSSDKDHSIMEFYPAHQAYQITKRQGFRTFVKKDGRYLEPFSDESNEQNMYVGMNEFEIEECNEKEGLQTNVVYYTLPMENIGGLIREVTFTNTGSDKVKLEVLDGMPALIPYGVSLSDMKEMGQTVKAWMQVEDVESRLPYFRVRASIVDSIAVQEIKEGNYSIGISEQGERLPVIVDPDVVFSYDTSMGCAVGLKEQSIAELLKKNQITENNLPCSFFALEKELQAGESVTFYEVMGMVKSKEILKNFAAKCTGRKYFEEKRKQATELTEDLCKVIRTKTGDPVFDAYCEQTYLDNLLRGGYPVPVGKNKIFYLYSRKHGDIERDYNFFQMSPEFYSQGNANFRDVNQNRRCDILFTPYVGDLNIKTFYNLIQTDGYNPLQVQKAVYTIRPEKLQEILPLVKEECREALEKELTKAFTPGSLAGFAMDHDILTAKKEDVTALEVFVGAVMDEADSAINAAFGEGYWTDHWTYNLDLVETYLGVYPDKEESLLFEDEDYTYFEAQAAVNPRRLRYEETAKGIRQYHTLNHEVKKGVSNKLVCTDYGKGEVYHGNLMEKLLLLTCVKLAALDPYGMGIEMEGGKPGWYDALNGMPGLLGSSMCETYELCRMIEFSMKALQKYNRPIVWAKEMSELMFALKDALETTASQEENGDSETIWKDMDTWNALNDVKEAYREKTLFGLSGRKLENTAEEILAVLKIFHGVVKQGIARALDYGKGISPSYFTYEVTDYEKKEDGIIIKKVEPGIMPHFLEGPVRYLKLDMEALEKADMYDKVKKSAMYDKELEMYKVNESLAEASFEVGRSKAFTPGWLENESIWLHMEYKYLLELLKSGMYREFGEDFRKAAVPFLDEEMYGRSPLENSSFIASSANHNKKIHGKGFVARLSGSTAEFIQMWQIMMFGKTPFTVENEELTLRFEPFIPKYLIGEEKQVEAVFLGSTPVVFHMEEIKDYIPGLYRIGVRVEYADGSSKEAEDGKITGEAARAVRRGEAKRIEITFH